LDKTTDGAFKLTFRPGRGFFTDYELYYRRRSRGRIQTSFQADQADTHEPMKVAALFEEKRIGRPAGTIATVLTGDVNTARELISSLGGYAEAVAFLDYALEEANRTHYDVQRLAGLKQYIPRFIQMRENRSRAAEDRQKRVNQEREEMLSAEYESWKRKHAQELYEGLPPLQRHAIEEQAHQLTQPGLAANMLLPINRIKVLQERYPDELPSFEKWASNRNHRVL
jgi:hypothetical protein